jgi:geranylgeranyl pyrophosphate synthase
MAASLSSRANAQRQSARDVIIGLKLDKWIDELRAKLNAWIKLADPEMQEALNWQFLGDSKFFRPLTIFCCYQAAALERAERVPEDLLVSAQVIEMFHNVSLIIDDIVDKSPTRRGKPTLHTRFGELNALMVAGYIVADGYDILARDLFRNQHFGAYRIRLFSELLKRLGVAECLQWRLRRKPLGVEDWRRIAGEDTGSMFEVCACLGGQGEKLRRYGGLLGTLYHGCDDVGDVRGVPALGGGGFEDLRDRILTLPAALAIGNKEVSKLFCTERRLTREQENQLSDALAAQLPNAEARLDEIAEQAAKEATRYATNPRPLLALVDYTRQLSTR